MIRYIYTLALIFITFTSFAQNKRANIWYFGKNAGLDFSTNPPTALTNGAMNTYEGCATVCDTAGKLLFYTNGENVWNKQHKLMINGTGLLGSWDATQSSLIVPWPESDSLFYIFTTDAVGQYSGFEWHLVNMNLDSGRGAVISKNNSILTPVCEKISATFHANGKDIWVTVHGFSKEYGPFDNDSFYTFQITSQGFQNCPVISKTGAIHGNDNRMGNGRVAVTEAQGQMSFSKDGHFLGVTCYQYLTPYNGVEIFEFDNVSGKLSFHSKGKGDLPFGFSFNSNASKYFATTRQGQLLEYQNIKDSITNPVVFYSASSSQPWTLTSLAYLNDSIILLSCTDSFYMSAVHLQPNNSVFDSRYIYLNGKKNLGGIPAFISNYFNTQEPPFYYTLSSDSINIYTQVDSPKWLLYKDAVLIDSSTIQNPSFKTTDNSHYIVKLITTSIDTFERKANTKPALVTTHNIILCDKDSFLLTANKDYHCVYWKDTIYTSDLWIYKNGVYKVNGLDGNNSYSADSIKVVFLKTPQLNLGKDTAFCGNEIYTLKGDSGYTYLWNTGDTSISIDVTQAGVYFLIERNGICETKDTIKLDILPVPYPPISKAGSILNVNPTYTNFQWYKNQQPINGAKASQYLAQANGNYYVVVIDSNGCEGSSDTVGLNVGIEDVTQSKPLVFPNPANEKVYIECDYFVSWQLFDIAGNLIDKGNNKTLEIRNHSSGIYLLKITSENNSYTYKLIKQ